MASVKIRKLLKIKFWTLLMKKITFFLIYFSLSAKALAANVVDVSGASLEEIAARTESGMSTFYKMLSLALVVIGFALFATSLIRLIKITKGEIPNARPMSAIAGMIFSAMLASSGIWLFAVTNTLKEAFTA